MSTRELGSVCMCVQQLTDLTVSCQGVDSFRESLETEVRVVIEFLPESIPRALTLESQRFRLSENKTYARINQSRS